MSMYVSGSRVTLVFFMAIFLAGCATPAPSPRLTATVVGSAGATVSQSDAASATAGSLPAPVLPPQMQSQMQPQAQPSAPASAALASNEHAEMTCAMHRKLMIAMTPEERQAVLAAHMRDMSPDMRKRYVERLKTCTGN